ncbi:BON domain-containing protein [Azospirillum sp. sgz302134]
MADYDARWRTDERDGHREHYGTGDVNRDLRESRRRLERAGDYNPEMLEDMRWLSGEGGAPYRGERYDLDRRGLDTRGYAGERHIRRDYGESGRDWNERGALDRGRDEVSSWFGDDEAQRRRARDRSEQDQSGWDQRHGYRGVGPRGYARSDERIREDVSERLTDDPYVDASDIDVTVSGCEVTLSGTVDDRRAKRRAEDVAESVSGVRHVQNNLRVRQQDYGGTYGSSGTVDPVYGRRY